MRLPPSLSSLLACLFVIMSLLAGVSHAFRPRYLVNFDKSILPASVNNIKEAIESRGAEIITTYDFAVFKGMLIQGGTLEEWKSLLEKSSFVRSVEVDSTVRTQSDYHEPVQIEE